VESRPATGARTLVYSRAIVAFEYWDKLLFGIQRGECILFLGPGLPLASSGGEPQRALTCRLLKGLDRGTGDRAGIDAGDLARVSQRYLLQEGEIFLEDELTHWHEELAGQRSTLHDDLAALPFRWIVTSSHDPCMETALREAGKTPAVERYHYRGTNKELLPEPTIEAPVLFHLYGHAAEPRSVVLTETQLLDFLAALISRNPPLPNDLNEALTNGRLFLFLGFGLRQWYLRILLHVLKVLRHGSRAFAVETLEEETGPSSNDAILFYQENFKVATHHDDVCEFVKELRSRYLPSSAGPGVAAAVRRPASAAPKVFICHASEDRQRASEIHDALKQAGLDPWLDKETLRGGDRWDALIESTIREVDCFLVLNSRALAAKSQGASYVNKEIKVALRAEDWRLVRHFIIPLKIDDAPLLEQLGAFHAVDLTRQEGIRDLIRAIKRQERTA